MSTDYEICQDKFPKIYKRERTDEYCSNHFHKKIELLYNLSDEKTVVVNNRTYRLAPDNLCIADCYASHHYEQNDNSVQLLLVLPVEYCHHYLNYRKGKTLDEFAIFDTEYCRSQILPYFLKIQAFDELDEFTLQSNIDILFANVCSKVGLSVQPFSPMYESIDKIIRYIDENHSSELSLDSLALKFGYSKYYFSRTFNTLFHTNINDYISFIRLQKTIEFYKHHDCTITSAALDNGFSSMATFYRVLKNYYGELADKQLKKERLDS